MTGRDIYLLGSDLFNSGMVINEIRRENFRRLVATEDNGEPSRAAARLGKQPGQISHLIGPNPTKGIGNKIARQVEVAYDKPVGWLDREHVEAREELAGYLVRDMAPEDGVPVTVVRSHDVIVVPVMNAEGSMGAGRVEPEHDAIVDSMRISRDFVRRNLPSVSNPAALRIVTGYGDSMLPTFGDGDPLLVDTGITEIRIDAVYVLSRDGELFIKRVQRRLDGAVIIKSDNPLYDPYTVPADQVGSLRVLARVVWAWNGKKL